jgi:hypothetical protein
MNNFDLYQWNKDGRPASKAIGSDAFEKRRHWQFTSNDSYFMLDGRPTHLYIRGGGYVIVDSKYYQGRDSEWYK